MSPTGRVPARADRRRLLGTLAALALAGALGCRRPSAAWVADLRHADPWRRRMAALALRSVADGELEHAFRALVLRLRDRDAEVVRALEESLRALARRRPDLPARALGTLATERTRYRAFMARLLLELEARGIAVDRGALEGYVAEEQASGLAAREEAVRALLAEFGR